MHVYPSDLRKIENLEEREKAYRQAVADKCFQDSLDTRISAKVGLSESESQSLLVVVGKGCRERTKLSLRRGIACVPDIRSYGIFSRVLFTDGEAHYCAGQSYPDEIRTVRECLL